LAVPRASGPVFKFCAPGDVFGVTEGVKSRFHVLRFQPHFRRYRGRRLLFSYFAFPNSFLVVTRATGQVPILCFALSASFSAVPRASVPVFMFCAPGIFFGGTKGVRSRFHVLRSRTHFRRYPRVSGTAFIFCAPVLVFGGTEGVGSCFHILCARTTFSVVPRASGPIFIPCAP
jgi:hypothetical protein